MNERRNVPEIVIEMCELLRRSQTRINLLFTMSEIPHARPVKEATCEVIFRGRYSGATCSEALCRSSIPSGGARRDRTDDLMLAKHALSQLSYGPVPEDECFTPFVETHLYDVTVFERNRARSRWWAWEDLNFRPHAYQARALTN